MNQILTEPITEIIKQAVLDHPNTLFSRQAFQITVNNTLEKVVDDALADYVAQGLIRNLDCSGKPNQAVYCLAAEHGGDEAASRQFFEEIIRITH